MTSASEGGCLCGAVRYRIEGEPRISAVCHCRSCRLASGATRVAWITVQRAAFAFTRGEPRRYRSSPPVLRSFCGECGSPLVYEHEADADSVDVTTATLDEPERFPPVREVWLEHRVAWESGDARLPRHLQGSNSPVVE